MVTLGEYRVGIDFNPGKNPSVDKIKRLAADLIDLCRTEADNTDNPEVERLWALAMTHLEDAAMWAVKATTKRNRD